MKYDPSKLKKYLEENPGYENIELYVLCGARTDSQKGYIRKAKSRIFNNIESSHESPEANKRKGIPPQNTPLAFIDDPDELLLSVSTRELNKPKPDPRWASILISVRKEQLGTSKKEGNIRSKFKSMNIKDIAMILNTKQKDISPKLDSKESS